jgi:hypothetical protein
MHNSAPFQAKSTFVHGGRGWSRVYRDLSRFAVPAAQPTVYAGFKSQSGSFWPAPRENDLHIHREALN